MTKQRLTFSSANGLSEVPLGDDSDEDQRNIFVPAKPQNIFAADETDAPKPEPSRSRSRGKVEFPIHPDANTVWEAVEQIKIADKTLARNRIISANRAGPAYVTFDVLRTKLLQALRANGWSRVAITSPTKGCGKSFTALNLAYSLSRRESLTTILMDMDLRNPSLANTLGVKKPPNLRKFLTGHQPMHKYLTRIRPNLAVGLNDSKVRDASELLQEPSTAAILAKMERDLRPDVILYDMPPALGCDDVLAFTQQVDGVLLVVGGGKTKTKEVEQVERLLKDQAPLLGVVLNTSDGTGNGKDDGYY